MQNIRELQSTRVDHEPHHQPHLLQPRAAPAGHRRLGPPLEEPLASRRSAPDDEPQRLRQHPELRALRHHGGTEDWTFWTAGSLGYTFEIGPNEFHPPYSNGVVDEYLGRGSPPAPARAATARPTTRCSRRPKQGTALGHRGLGAQRLGARRSPRRSPRRPRRSGTTTSGRTSGRFDVPGHARVHDDDRRATVRVERQPVHAAGRRRARPRAARRPPQADHASPTRRASRPRTPATRSRARTRSSIRRRGPARGRQRPHDGPHRLGRPEDRLGPLHLRRAATSSPSRRPSATPPRTRDDRPAGGALHRGDRQLRPGRRPGVRRLGQRPRGLREPAPAQETPDKEAWTFTCTSPDGKRHAASRSWSIAVSAPTSATPAQRPPRARKR